MDEARRGIDGALVSSMENAVIRFADEKPKRKARAPKPGRLKVSDGAKALAAFNRTAAKRKRRASQPADPAAGDDEGKRPPAENEGAGGTPPVHLRAIENE